MIKVNIHEAKTQLSRLLAKVEEGEVVIIARSGNPVARLSPYTEGKQTRHFGRDMGQFIVPDNFDDPLPDDVLRSFES